MTAPEHTFRQIASRACDLYTLPAVAMKVLELTSSEKVDTRCLKQCIENDPALTTKILRVVNSSLFGLSREVKDLNQALALLGIKPLKLLVLGFSLPEQLFEGASTESLSRYWRLSLTKAVAARQISEVFWDRAGDDAFIAGLLEDIGLLVLIREIGVPYQVFLDRVAEIGNDLCTSEAVTLGFDHCQLSAEVLEQWKLPADLISAIARPRSLDALAKLPADEAYLPQVLHLTNLVAQLVAWKRLPVLPDLLESGERFCHLDKSKLTDLVQDLEGKVDSLADVLSLNLPAGTAYARVLTEAHEQLAQVACDVAGELLSTNTASPFAAPDVASDHRLLVEARELANAARRVAAEFVHHKMADCAGTPRAAQTPSQSDSVGLAAQPVAEAAMATEHPPQDRLMNHLYHAVAESRQQRTELSLMLAELDQLDQLAATCGPAMAIQLVELLDACWQPLSDAAAVPVSRADGRLAVILPSIDRRQAVEQGNMLVRALSEKVGQTLGESLPIPTLSIGIASIAAIPKNFPPTDLVEAAERCLYGARTCGGNAIKSIEIY